MNMLMLEYIDHDSMRKQKCMFDLYAVCRALHVMAKAATFIEKPVF